MTDRQQQLIEGYLPHPRDPELEWDQYYVLDTSDRVRKVEIREILPHDPYIEYGVYEVSTGRRVDPGWGSEWRGFRMGHLYDNKEDCRHREHDMYDDWEHLRKIQEEENG